jgi:hypothetical protein
MVTYLQPFYQMLEDHQAGARVPQEQESDLHVGAFYIEPSYY